MYHYFYHDREKEESYDTSYKSRGSNKVDGIGHREDKTERGPCTKASPHNSFLGRELNKLFNFCSIFYLNPLMISCHKGDELTQRLVIGRG